MILKKKLFVDILILALTVILPYAIMSIFYRDINLETQNFAKQDVLFTVSIMGSALLTVFSFFGRAAASREHNRRYKIIFTFMAVLGILLAVGFIWLFNIIAGLRYALI